MRGEGGTIFGRYRLLRVIASDAVSTTHLATADAGPRPSGTPGGDRVAVRIADPRGVTDTFAVDVARQFLSEAREAGAVDHPTVLRPRDLGMVDGRPYVVTPFVDAEPLGRWLAHGPTIDQSAALAMFAQLAAALDASHRAGVVHGAVSPQTIWVGPSAGGRAAYVAYLTGFGTAMLLHEHLGAAPRPELVDDVLYVSPEQLRGAPVAGFADQYALACAVYHTLSGNPPYVRQTLAKLYGAHLLVPPPRLADHPAVAASTSDAVARAMAKDPADRFPSCGAMIHEALPAGQDAPVVARRRRPRERSPGRPPAGASRRWRAAALAGAAAVILAGALWAVLRAL